MNIAVEFAATGDPTVLKPVSHAIQPPNLGEVRVRHTMIGVNYVDIYHRSGLYPIALPAIPGVEAVGVVDAVAEGVTDFQIGECVVYASLPAGSYQTMRNIKASQLIKVPDSLSDKTIAGTFLRGMTAHMLLEQVTTVQAGQTVLIHAAAGGLGLILTQWAKIKGATTIGTISSTAKADLATAHGLDYPILYQENDFVQETLRLTKGKGVDYAIDGIGGKTLLRTLKTVRPFGITASIGQTSGPIAQIDPRVLTNVKFSCPSIVSLISDEARYKKTAKAWLDILASGLKINEGATYPLSQAPKAHDDMEQRLTSGPVRLSVD